MKHIKNIFLRVGAFEAEILRKVENVLAFEPQLLPNV